MLRKAFINSLLQVSDILDVVQGLPEDKATEFYQDCNAGKHIRHVLDHLLTFIVSVETGVLDYNCRNRESIEESDWHAAQAQLDQIISTLEALPIGEQTLQVISETDSGVEMIEHFSSNVPREILFLINHTMHHAAYIRLLAKGCDITFPEHIGIAPATATYIRKIG
jgi:hypothetical protein